MLSTTLYILGSVLVVSLVSFVGAFSISLNQKFTRRFLLILVSLSAGTLFGDAFLHLLPEAANHTGFDLQVSLLLLSGVVVFFLLEKLIHWHHCHSLVEDEKVHAQHRQKSIAPLNLLADALHNFLDGLIIAASYLISIPVGAATTLAVVLHEVPQEIADFGVLLYSGLSKGKALFLNFLSAVTAIIGAIVGIIIATSSERFILLILPFAAGGFLYTAGSNLIPELHKECGLKDSFWHFIALVAGIGIMLLLTFVE